jgi:hypothetical protein
LCKLEANQSCNEQQRQKLGRGHTALTESKNEHNWAFLRRREPVRYSNTHLHRDKDKAGRARRSELTQHK